MDNINKMILDYLFNLIFYGIPPIFIFIIFIVIFKPDLVDKWRGIIWKLFVWAGTKSQKNHIKYYLQGALNTEIDKFESEFIKFPKTKYKIKWASGDDIGSHMENGQLIIRLRHYTKREENLIAVANAYVNKSLIESYKPFLSRNDCRVISSYSIAKLLRQGKYNNAYNHFMENDLKNELSHSDFGGRFKECQSIDFVGNFSRLLLREYHNFGMANPTVMPTEEIKEELSSFFDFIHKLSTKPAGQDINLSHDGNFISCSVVLVAKFDTFDEYGFEAYVRRIREQLSLGYNTIYIQARDQNIGILSRVIASFEDSRHVSVIRLPNHHYKEHRSSRMSKTYIIISKMHNRIETVKHFRNISSMPDAETVYFPPRLGDSLKTEIADPSSGYKLVRLTIFQGDYFANFYDIANKKYIDWIHYDDCDFIDGNELLAICENITNSVTTGFIKSVKHPKHYYKVRMVHDLPILDILIYENKVKRVFIGIRHDSAMDSVCSDIFKEANILN